MLLSCNVVTEEVDVDAALLIVDGLTSESDGDADVIEVTNGTLEGLPDVSREVTTLPVVLWERTMVADCTWEVVKVVRTLGTVVMVTGVIVVVELTVSIVVRVSVIVVPPAPVVVAVVVAAAWDVLDDGLGGELLDGSLDDVLELDEEDVLVVMVLLVQGTVDVVHPALVQGPVHELDHDCELGGPLCQLVIVLVLRTTAAPAVCECDTVSVTGQACICPSEIW